jgi:hypothetical protein
MKVSPAVVCEGWYHAVSRVPQLLSSLPLERLRNMFLGHD